MDRMNGPHNLGAIRFLTGPLAGTTFPLSKPITTIGREPGNDVVVSDPSVSRRHAQITWNNGTWTISKLNPQNTLFVNKRDVPQTVIHENDTIGLGATTFLFLPVVGTPGQAMQVESAAQAGFNMPPPFSPQPQQVPQAQPFQPQPQLAPQAQPFPIPGMMPPPPPGFSNDPSGTQIAPAGISPLLTQSAPNNVQSLEVSSNIHHDRRSYMLNKQVINIGR